MNDHLDSLTPAPLWRHFRTLCNTPRPSGHEAQLARTIVDWASARGMSHDFDVAIQEGATMVRVGTAIFGRRTPPAHQPPQEGAR